MKKSNICTVTFSRKMGDQVIKIKIKKELEELLKDNTNVSGNYFSVGGDAVYFYALNTKVKAMYFKYKEIKNAHIAIDHFGEPLLVSELYNLSIIRTQGLSEGKEILIPGLIIEDDIKKWINELGNFLQFLYKNYIMKQTIKAEISIIY